MHSLRGVFSFFSWGKRCIKKIREILHVRFAFRCSSLVLLQAPVALFEDQRTVMESWHAEILEWEFVRKVFQLRKVCRAPAALLWLE